MKINNNNNFSIKDINKEVVLNGWVSKKRNLGGVIFIDLRDRSGIIQLVVNPDNKNYDLAEQLKSEYVIEVKGIIKERSNKNPNLKTGDIEVIVSELNIINSSIDTPFEINNNTTALEDTRLKYRYLDIRRDPIKERLITRHKITMSARKYFDSMGFIEVETPILCRSTPEGARDYLVPSRVSNGKFYALPQSPQIFKQLLMVGGIEKYFQIAKCFRDEDLRADRQPEFTQIDVEMSFVNEEDVMSVAENMIATIFKEVKNIDIELPLLKMKYDDAINYYGSDKPDLRFDMKIQDVTNIFKNTDFSLFKNIVDNNELINVLVANDTNNIFSRKEIDKLTEFVKTYKSSGLFYLKFNDEVTGSIAKSINESELTELKNKLNIKNGDVVFFIVGKENIVKSSMGALRLKLGRMLNLIDDDIYKLLWVVDFPSFEYSEEDKRYYACHHPFTAPKDSDVDKLLTDPGKCYSKAYDIVINGYEAGGGSIRIHNRDIQKKMFEALGFTDEVAYSKFGYLMDAFKYGTPPHGGIAFGLDRLTMLLTNTDNIRDVIAFPKTASASDLMCESPNVVDNIQLDELHIGLK